jgi:hypothetical protein
MFCSEPSSSMSGSPSIDIHLPLGRSGPNLSSEGGPAGQATTGLEALPGALDGETRLGVARAEAQRCASGEEMD